MIGDTVVVISETKTILEDYLSKEKVNIEEINTKHVVGHEEVNVEVNKSK